jgi:hypothetical protein
MEKTRALVAPGGAAAGHPATPGKGDSGHQTPTNPTGKRPYSGEFRVRRPDGTERWVLSRAVPRLDDAGNVIALVGTSTDITSRKRAEDEVARLNTELEARVVERTAELESAPSCCAS